jgi:DNA polymerase III gamma/tau subunit
MRFKGIHYSHIETLVKDVARKEGYTVYDDVAKAIREQAGGSARQALMILEFIMTLDNPTPDDVVEITGKPKEENVFSLLYGALKGKMSTLNKYDALVKQGVDPMQILMMMYYGAMRGSLRGITDGQRLRIIRAIGSVPMSTDEQNVAAALARIVDLSARKRDKQ